jgi:hypothetical protein
VVFSGTPVSSTNTTDCHDITEILLKVALNTIKPNQTILLLFHKVDYIYYVKIGTVTVSNGSQENPPPPFLHVE